jgi:DNA-binding response OmpR family regulator
MKILVIEDEPKVASFIKQGLEEQTKVGLNKHELAFKSVLR